MLTISVDRDRLSTHLKANVTVRSDEYIQAFEARATLAGQPCGRGIGCDLLADEFDEASGYYYDSESGVAYPPEPYRSVSFDVEAAELNTDGEYRISIYVMNKSGVWNDTCILYTKNSESVIDSDGAYILVMRNTTGEDESYTSAYSGKEIDDFITEVLS